MTRAQDAIVLVQVDEARLEGIGCGIALLQLGGWIRDDRFVSVQPVRDNDLSLVRPSCCDRFELYTPVDYFETQCNGKTGLYDAIPCRGRCSPHEKCDQTGLFEKCVPDVQVDLHIEQKSTEPARQTPK